MAGVYHFLVYMQSAINTTLSIIIHHHGGAQRPRGGVHTNYSIWGQFAYTPRNNIHQPFSYRFLNPNLVVVCIYMVSPPVVADFWAKAALSKAANVFGSLAYSVACSIPSLFMSSCKNMLFNWMRSWSKIPWIMYPWQMHPAFVPNFVVGLFTWFLY